MALSTAYRIIPTTELASQQITTTLNQQACVINLYAKTTNVPAEAPDEITSDPIPRYENINPCFLDLYLAGNLVLGGVYLRQGTLLIRDTYFGFSGDLVVFDTTGAGADPVGVSPILPPLYLRNPLQIAEYPLSLGDQAPNLLAGTIPGMGSQFILTYWPAGTYTPGYSFVPLP